MSTSPVYAGFWLRLAASVVDTVWLGIVVYALLAVLIGPQALSPDAPHTPLSFMLGWVLPIAVVIGFWVFRSATPGKMLFNLKVVDAQTLGPVPVPRLLLRYVGYYIAAIPLAIGFLWVGWDARKQGWHDKLAGTVVIRTSASGNEPQQAAAVATQPTQGDNAWPT